MNKFFVAFEAAFPIEKKHKHDLDNHKREVGSKLLRILGKLDALKMMLQYKAEKTSTTEYWVRGATKVASMALTASALAPAGGFGLGPAIGSTLEAAVNTLPLGHNSEVAAHRAVIVEAVQELLLSSFKSFNDAVGKTERKSEKLNDNTIPFTFTSLERIRAHMKVVLQLMLKVAVCNKDWLINDNEHTVQFVPIDSDILISPYSRMFVSEEKRPTPHVDLGQAIHLFVATQRGLQWSQNGVGDAILEALEQASSIGDGLYGTPGYFWGADTELPQIAENAAKIEQLS